MSKNTKMRMLLFDYMRMMSTGHLLNRSQRRSAEKMSKDLIKQGHTTISENGITIDLRLFTEGI